MNQISDIQILNKLVEGWRGAVHEEKQMDRREGGYNKALCYGGEGKIRGVEKDSYAHGLSHWGDGR